MRRLFPRGYGFTVLGIAVGMAGLVALGAMAERISRFIEGGDRFVLGQISVAGEGMGMGAGFTAGGLLPAARLAEIAKVPGVALVQPQVMLPINPSTSSFMTLTQELLMGMDRCQSGRGGALPPATAASRCWASTSRPPTSWTWAACCRWAPSSSRWSAFSTRP
jgi:hypothetical protein